MKKISQHWVDGDCSQIIITGHRDYDSVIQGGGIRFEMEDASLLNSFDISDSDVLDEIIDHLINLRSEVFAFPRVQDESADAHLRFIDITAKMLWEDSTDPETTAELLSIGRSVQLARIALKREREGEEPPEKPTISIAKRSRDIKACLAGHPEIWGCGDNVKQAIGAMVQAHIDVFGLESIEWERGEGK